MFMDLKMYYYKLNINMSMLPKAIYRFNAISIKLPMPFSTELEQIILKFIWNHKRSKLQSNPEEKEHSWRHNPPRLQTIVQSYSNQNSVVLAQKQTDQWNRLESPEINPHTYG